MCYFIKVFVFSVYGAWSRKQPRWFSGPVRFASISVLSSPKNGLSQPPGWNVSATVSYANAKIKVYNVQIRRFLLFHTFHCSSWFFRAPFLRIWIHWRLFVLTSLIEEYAYFCLVHHKLIKAYFAMEISFSGTV